MLQVEWTLYSKTNSKWPWLLSTYVRKHTNTLKCPLKHADTHVGRSTFSLKMHFWHFYTSRFLPCVHLPNALASSLESSVVVAVRGAERLRRVGIAFWFPQSLLSGSRQDFSLIVTTGVVLWIRGAHKRWWGLMPGAGVGECSQGTGRVQNKEFSGSKVWGRSIRIEGGPMDKIGLAEKSPPETRGEKLPI